MQSQGSNELWDAPIGQLQARMQPPPCRLAAPEQDDIEKAVAKLERHARRARMLQQRMREQTDSFSATMSAAMDIEDFLTPQIVRSMMQRRMEEEAEAYAYRDPEEDKIRAGRDHLVDRLTGREAAAIKIQRAFRLYQRSKFLRRWPSWGYFKTHVADRIWHLRPEVAPLPSYSIDIASDYDSDPGTDAEFSRSVSRAISRAWSRATSKNASRGPSRVQTARAQTARAQTARRLAFGTSFHALAVEKAERQDVPSKTPRAAAKRDRRVSVAGTERRVSLADPDGASPSPRSKRESGIEASSCTAQGEESCAVSIVDDVPPCPPAPAAPKPAPAPAPVPDSFSLRVVPLSSAPHAPAKPQALCMPDPHPHASPSAATDVGKAPPAAASPSHAKPPLPPSPSASPTKAVPPPPPLGALCGLDLDPRRHAASLFVGSNPRPSPPPPPGRPPGPGSLPALAGAHSSAMQALVSSMVQRSISLPGMDMACPVSPGPRPGGAARISPGAGKPTQVRTVSSLPAGFLATIKAANGGGGAGGAAAAGPVGAGRQRQSSSLGVSASQEPGALRRPGLGFNEHLKPLDKRLSLPCVGSGSGAQGQGQGQGQGSVQLSFLSNSSCSSGVQGPPAPAGVRGRARRSSLPTSDQIYRMEAVEASSRSFLAAPGAGGPGPGPGLMGQAKSTRSVEVRGPVTGAAFAFARSSASGAAAAAPEARGSETGAYPPARSSASGAAPGGPGGPGMGPAAAFNGALLGLRKQRLSIGQACAGAGGVLGSPQLDSGDVPSLPSIHVRF